MSAKPDGGPAFPLESGAVCESDRGMTMRDWFAVHANLAWSEMTPIWAARIAGITAPTAEQEKDWEFMGEWWLKAEVAYRYRFADAMLAEREK